MISGRYKVQGALAETGRSRILRGIDQKTGRAVAFKQVKEEELARIEAQILERLNHPNIVRLYDTFQGQGGEFVLVLELVHGRRFHDVAAKLDGVTIVDALKQLVLALQYLKQHGLCHGDLKKSNILYDERQNLIKLIDFGTREGEGTFGYTAPEHDPRHPEQVTWRSDVYAFGVLLESFVPDAADLIKLCKAEEPRARPEYDYILARLNAFERRERIKVHASVDFQFQTSYKFLDSQPRREYGALVRKGVDQNGRELVLYYLEDETCFDSMLAYLRRYRNNPLVPDLLQAGAVSPGEMGHWLLAVEHIDGIPLKEWLEGEGQGIEKKRVLLQLAVNLAEIHGHGDFHANLQEEVYYDIRKRLPRLGGFCHSVIQSDVNWHPGSLPETDVHAVPCPASDVFDFAEHFLSQVKSSPRLDRLCRACLAEDPFDRPSMETVAEVLEQEINRAPRRLFPGLAVAAALFLAIIVFFPGNLVSKPVNFFSGGQDSIQHRIVHMSPADFVQPVAVFRFAQGPLLVGRTDFVREGDTVDFGGGNKAVITKIGFKQVVLNRDGYFDISNFRSPKLNQEQQADDLGVLIWPSQSNLDYLMGIMAKVSGRQFDNSDNVQGKFYGFFPAQNVEAFLGMASSSIGLDFNQKQLRLFDNGKLPAVINLPRAQITNKSTHQILQYVEGLTGFPIAVDGTLPRKSLELFEENLSWSDLLEAYDLNWNVEKRVGVPTIVVSAKAN